MRMPDIGWSGELGKIASRSRFGATAVHGIAVLENAVNSFPSYGQSQRTSLAYAKRHTDCPLFQPPSQHAHEELIEATFFRSKLCRLSISDISSHPPYPLHPHWIQPHPSSKTILGDSPSKFIQEICQKEPVDLFNASHSTLNAIDDTLEKIEKEDLTTFPKMTIQRYAQHARPSVTPFRKLTRLRRTMTPMK